MKSFPGPVGERKFVAGFATLDPGENLSAKERQKEREREGQFAALAERFRNRFGGLVDKDQSDIREDGNLPEINSHRLASTTTFDYDNTSVSGQPLCRCGSK